MQSQAYYKLLVCLSNIEPEKRGKTVKSLRFLKLPLIEFYFGYHQVLSHLLGGGSCHKVRIGLRFESIILEFVPKNCTSIHAKII